MSNLKSRLTKTARVNEREIMEKLNLIIEDLISEKASEIGWNEGLNGVDELVAANMEVDGGLDVDTMASVIFDAVEKWGKETKENYSEDLE